MIDQLLIKLNNRNILKMAQDLKFWLLATLLGLITLHISLTWQLTEDIDRLSISVLAWGAVLFLAWSKRNQLNLESNGTASLVGTTLIVLVLLKSSSFFWFESDLVRVLPLAIALGLALLASGFKGLKQYWREFLVVSILAIPEGLLLDPLESIFQVSLLTAKIGALALWRLGFEVQRQGVYIILPTGVVEVYPGCSGLSAMFLLFRLSVLYLIIFPTTLFKSTVIPVIAVLIAYFFNGVRVALMAFLVAFSNQSAFEYWHTGDGSQIFAMIAVLAFGLLCSFITQDSQNEPELQATAD